MAQGGTIEVDGVACTKCGGTELRVTESTDPFGKLRRKADCAYCGSYIKFLPVLEDSKDFVMPFGKFKGKRLADIDDGYLQWMWDNMNLRPNMKGHIEKVMIERGLF